MTEVEEYKAIIEALDHAHGALQREARAEHETTKPGPGQLHTREMCRCGVETALGSTKKCDALRTMSSLLAMYRQALHKAEQGAKSGGQ